MTKLALFVRYGVEARVFMNEATRDRVKEATVFHTVQSSQYLKRYAQEYGVELCHIGEGVTEKLNLWGAWFNASRTARNRLNRRTNYKHYSILQNHRRPSDYLKGNRIVYEYLDWMHRRSFRQYVSPSLIAQILDRGIGEMWFSGYSSAANLSMAINAKKAGCRTTSYINSWKDYYVNNHVPRVFDELRVWSDTMRGQYLSANPHLREDHVVVAGNPRLTALCQHKPVHEADYYCHKFGLSSDHFILYTALNPKVYDREPDIVKLILKELKASLGDHAPGILIKTNPMDSNPGRWDELADIPNVGVIYADWEWDAEMDFNLPSLESDLEWVLDQYYYHLHPC